MIVESGIGTKLLSRRSIALLAVLLTALAACSSNAKPKTGGETFVTGATTTAAAGVEPTAYVESGDYTNGRHMAKLTAFDETSVTFDVVQFLTGDEAKQAWQQDVGGEMDTDFYIRNRNKRLRTLPVVPEVAIHVNISAGYEPADDHLINARTLAAYMKAGDAQKGYFWLRIQDGKVTSISEQYIS
jgi:hypothetical protein